MPPAADNSDAVPAIVTLGPNVPRHARIDIPAAVRDALSHLGQPDSLTVLVNDPQRHTASREVLAELCRHVEGKGIRLLVATGTHRFPREVKSAFERSLADGLGVPRIAWHDCASRKLLPVGGRWRGHPWLVEKPAVLAIGSVEPHYFAGFTGAHKTATIGCASRADIEANHALALEGASRPACLDGNPVHDAIVKMLAALSSVQRVAAVNLVQAGERLLWAFGGEAILTLRAAAERAAETFICRIGVPADALVLDVSGPLGRSFYQADKGVKNNEHAVCDGGCLVLVADCRDGIGQDAFTVLLRSAPTHETAMLAVRRRGYRLGDHKAVRLRRLMDPKGRNVRLFVVSEGLSARQCALLGAHKAPTVRAALAAAGIDLARGRIYRVADAGNVCTRVGE